MFMPRLGALPGLSCLGSVLKAVKKLLCGMSQEKVRPWIFMCCLCWQLLVFRGTFYKLKVT